MPRLAGTRELMRLVRKTHHHRRDFPEFERAKHFFSTGAGRRAEIGFAENEHHRRLHILDVSERRARFELLLVVERRRFEPARLKQSKIGCVPPITPTRDVALRDGRGETRRLPNYPVREQSAAAAAGYAEFLFIDISTPDH